MIGQIVILLGSFIVMYVGIFTIIKIFLTTFLD